MLKTILKQRSKLKIGDILRINNKFFKLTETKTSFNDGCRYGDTFEYFIAKNINDDSETQMIHMGFYSHDNDNYDECVSKVASTKSKT